MRSFSFTVRRLIVISTCCLLLLVSAGHCFKRRCTPRSQGSSHVSTSANGHRRSVCWRGNAHLLSFNIPQSTPTAQRSLVSSNYTRSGDITIAIFSSGLLPPPPFWGVESGRSESLVDRPLLMWAVCWSISHSF